MPRARLILNPIPWRRVWHKLPDITSALEDAGVHVDLSFTKMTEAMTSAVRQAVDDGCDIVIAGGGDGTVSEVAAGLVGTDVPLGILPFGTFNNIAHSLGLPFDLAEATANIVRGYTTRIDVCVANGTYFFEAAGIGLDASLFPIGEDIKGGHYEKLLEGAARFLRHRKADFHLILDGKEHRLRSPMVVVANGPYYGAGFSIAPGADLTDGLLEVVTFECSKVSIARHFALSAGNRAHNEVCMTEHKAREVAILPKLPLPVHADGKPLATAPLFCSVVPQALRVIVPAPL